MTELVLPANADKDLSQWMEENEGDIDTIVQTFFRIKNKQGQVVPFIYNQAQRLHAERSTDFDKVLKARKAGISSRRIARDLAICATRKNEHAVLITHTGDAAQKLMLERIGPLIKECIYPLGATQRAEYIYFPLTGSRYYVGKAGAKKFGRGDDITRRHFTERAHWVSPDISVGIDEAMAEGYANGLDETTANGHNFWKKEWSEAKKGKTKERAIFLPWYACEDYYRDPALEPGPISEEEHAIMSAFKLSSGQIAWRRWKKRTMSDPSLFHQEYPETDEEAFLSTGRPVFDKLALSLCRQTCCDAKWRGYLVRKQDRIEFIPDLNGPLRIWKMPERGHVYAIGSDVAEGLADGAYSTGEVLDLGDSEQVAEWHGHCAPDILADNLALLSSFYNQGVIVPEAWPGPGEVTTSHLLDLKAKVWHNAEKDRHGFETNRHTKTQMIAVLNGALRDHSLVIRSLELLEELHAYTYDDSMAMEPSLGNFSDRLMGLGIVYFATRDLAERVDYYAAKRVSQLGLPSRPDGGGVSVPRWEGPRLGVRQR